MNVVVHIPDEFAARLSDGGDVERQVLEALAVEAYRTGRLSKPELRRLLGFGTRGELDGFLKARDVFDDYTIVDFEREQEALDQLGL